jgi:hypothetical protein
MGTLIGMGVAAVSATAKGIKLFLDGKDESGAGDMRFDFNDNCHPNEPHYHAGESKGGVGGLLDFAFGVAYTQEKSYLEKTSFYYCCDSKSLSTKEDLGDLEKYVSTN